MKDRWQADRANLIQNWISNWKWVKTITILIASHVIVLQWNSLFLWQLYSTVIKSYLVTSCKFSIEVAQEWHFAKTKKLQKKNQFHSLCIMNCIRPSACNIETQVFACSSRTFWRMSLHNQNPYMTKYHLFHSLCKRLSMCNIGMLEMAA